jgi:hypothetical protein
MNARCNPVSEKPVLQAPERQAGKPIDPTASRT